MNVSRKCCEEKHVDLLLIGEGEKEISKRHIKDCFKINDNQRITMPRKGEYVKFKNS